MRVEPSTIELCGQILEKETAADDTLLAIQTHEFLGAVYTLLQKKEQAGTHFEKAIVSVAVN